MPRGRAARTWVEELGPTRSVDRIARFISPRTHGRDRRPRRRPDSYSEPAGRCHESCNARRRQRSNRAIVRLLNSRIVREYNQLILDTAAHMRPDILFAFKGTVVTRATL